MRAEITAPPQKKKMYVNAQIEYFSGQQKQQMIFKAEQQEQSSKEMGGARTSNPEKAEFLTLQLTERLTHNWEKKLKKPSHMITMLRGASANPFSTED